MKFVRCTYDIEFGGSFSMMAATLHPTFVTFQLFVFLFSGGRGEVGQNDGLTQPEKKKFDVYCLTYHSFLKNLFIIILKLYIILLKPVSDFIFHLFFLSANSIYFVAVFDLICSYECAYVCGI